MGVKTKTWTYHIQLLFLSTILPTIPEACLGTTTKMVVIPRFERIYTLHTRNLVPFTPINFVLHVFCHVIILILIPVILSGDPFRASRARSDQKGPPPQVCEWGCQAIAAAVLLPFLLLPLLLVVLLSTEWAPARAGHGLETVKKGHRRVSDCY